MGKKSRNKNKKDNSAPCDCPGCLVSRMADQIQNCLLIGGTMTPEEFHEFLEKT